MKEGYTCKNCEKYNRCGIWKACGGINWARECKMFLLKATNADLRECFVEDKKAWFHLWANIETPIMHFKTMLCRGDLIEQRKKFIKYGIVDDCCEIVMRKFVFALVEFEDGTCDYVEPKKIRFAR